MYIELVCNALVSHRVSGVGSSGHSVRHIQSLLPSYFCTIPLSCLAPYSWSADESLSTREGVLRESAVRGLVVHSQLQLQYCRYGEVSGDAWSIVEY